MNKKDKALLGIVEALNAWACHIPEASK